MYVSLFVYAMFVMGFHKETPYSSYYTPDLHLPLFDFLEQVPVGWSGDFGRDNRFHVQCPP